MHNSWCSRKWKQALMQLIGQARPVDDYCTGKDTGCMLIQISMLEELWLTVSQDDLERLSS